MKKKENKKVGIMKPTYLDTDKIIEIGNDIINLANDYELEITNLFKRLLEMPFVTKEWVGNQAEKYVKIISLDKSDFMNFGEFLKEYGKEVLKVADEFNLVVSRNIREEDSQEII